MPVKTILVVDDSPTALKITSDTLSEQGFKVLCASDGEEALEIAARLRARLDRAGHHFAQEERFSSLPAAQNRNRDAGH